MWLHRFALVVAASTVVLISAGGLVTSTGSGLAVPDWPTTYGWSMFSFPLDKMVGGIFYEHGHRLIATTVGMLTIGLAVWLWVAERRRWLRRLGAIALAAVCVQGLLGALTVRYFLPAPVSIAHAGVAEIFFCLTVAIAVFTSRSWTEARVAANGRRLRAMATATTAAVYCQILLGATMRHTGAGLAIPDFPLVFGGLLPPAWTPAIAVHYSHRLGALVVTSLLLATVWCVRQQHRLQGQPGGGGSLLRPAMLTLPLVTVQIALGGLTVLSGRAVAINTAHVVTGALVLGTSLVVTLRAWRPRILGPEASRRGSVAPSNVPAERRSAGAPA